jgi:predicted lipoprotein with Yx(FWY)xxD motif
MEASTMRRLLTISGLLLAATVLVGCSATGASPTASVAPASPAGPATLEAESVGDLGTVLVAGSNRMTVYIFSMDVKDSGTSACTGECLANWPALTVPAGATPTGGSGVTGTLGTITRTDDGSLQVTYNGLPLYFFINDKAPGDATGVYENWEAVRP